MTEAKPKSADWQSIGSDVAGEAYTGASFVDVPWDHFTAPDLGRAALVPTMLNMKEQSYYVWLGRDRAMGQGAIVDLGSFAGGSAACLAEGVAQAGRDQRVEAYDKFDLQNYDGFKDRCARYWSDLPASGCGHEPDPLPGDPGNDLLPLAQHFLRPWGDNVTFHKGQIEDMGWREVPIEILVMDASKTARTMDKMSATFFPHLIPGVSVVVQQDFLWWQQPWIAAQMMQLAEYFTPVAYVPRYSVSFLCKKPIPKEVIDALHVAEMTDQDIIRALRQARDALSVFSIERPLRRLIKAVRTNPGERRAFKMRKPQ